MKVLKVKNLNSGYGKLHVLFDINVECGKSEIVSILGPNGSGKIVFSGKPDQLLERGEVAELYLGMKSEVQNK